MQTTRMAKMRTGVTSTLRVGKVTKGAATRRLILTGIRPRIYGFSVLGAAPTTVMNVRTSLVKGLCIRKPAGCATTALATHGYQDKDPLVSMMVENVTGMVEAIRQENGPTLIHRKAFDTILASMPESRRWSHVKGPISSAIATLLDHGWHLDSISEWTDPAGNKWGIDFAEPLIVDQVKEVLVETFGHHVWEQQAAKHFAGINVKPDLTAYFKMRKQFEREKDFRRLYFLDSVVQGSAGNLAEQAIHLKDGLPTCNLCLQTVEGCPFSHLCYSCTAICNSGFKGVEATQHLVGQANVEALIHPHIWLRGLFPLSVPDPLDHSFKVQASFEHNVSGKLLGGDGSGGPHSKDFRTRRCGFGLVILCHIGAQWGRND